MGKSRWLLVIYVISLPLFAAAAGSTAKTRQWNTLKGNEPVVIARGGFSGVFPDSSSQAYAFAIGTSLPKIVLWCDVQLTSDRVGICLPGLNLNNGSDIENIFANKSKTYSVNGIPMTGWFALDFTLNDLASISLTQGIYSRTPKFDHALIPITTVEDVTRVEPPAGLPPPSLWLNIQYAAFYSQHKLNMRSFVLSASKKFTVNYISSPEVNFLRSIVTQFKRSPTKLIFRFLGKNDIEPSTNQTYDSLLKNLTFVKEFASGILVPKSYIWPVYKDLYLQPHTPLVFDAHKEGLEIFASDFSNDVPFAYNFSFDPVLECLKFIDSDNFSVDGVLSDFPITPSLAIGCYSHMDSNDSRPATPLIISHEGASGDYPGCTDLSYTKAISDGADILDCPVQMTKDNIPFCLGSINLIQRTTAAQGFSQLIMSIPQLNGDGIYSFHLTWSEIQSLQPEITNPFKDSVLFRNPVSKNAGNIMSLSDFLALANNATSVSGVLIRIENAAYLAEQGMDVINATLDALSKAGYDNQKVKKVMIRSSSSAVLRNLKEKKNNYELVYDFHGKVVRDITNSTIVDIKKFANSLIIEKESVYNLDENFLASSTGLVPKLKAFNLPVYVTLFQNEFISQPYDFFSDPHVELNNFVVDAEIDGVITDFPGTASKYRRNRCQGDNTPNYALPVPPGLLLGLMQPLPPAAAPSPVLEEGDVVEPPFPSVAVIPVNETAKPPMQSSNSQAKVQVGVLLSKMAIFLPAFLLF